MKRVWAITCLTFKSASRFRLIPVLGALLLGAVVALPLVIKDDGTARGFAQILLTYTLSVITALLGFATLWLACGTLAREVEECQMQLIAVKPVARWQIWLGKWLGIMMLNGLLLALSGGAVYFLLQWRAQRLPEAQRKSLESEVLVARGSAKESVPDLEPIVNEVLQKRLEQMHTRQAAMRPFDLQMLRNQIREQLKAEYQLVRPGFFRRWIISLGPEHERLRDQPLFLRVKFSTTKRDESTTGPPQTYLTLWQIGVPDTPRLSRLSIKLAADSFQQFQIPPNLFDSNGVLTIDCINPNDTDLLFQLEDGLEVLYPAGGFGLNFVRGLGIIYCWLALLAAIGLSAASFLSFPVATFFALGILVIGLSSGTLQQIIQDRGISEVNHDTGTITNPLWFDHMSVFFFSAILKVVNLVQGFSPIDSLSTGRWITWGQLGRAVGQIVLLLGGAFSVLGISLFTRRELATAQGNQ
ncbi:MAG: hypothetical protein M1608_15385 [Candidatus Omnitrophica bacterium]|nr:hypothetical protein [Candidatus Omnitrophota bacterium]